MKKHRAYCFIIILILGLMAYPATCVSASETVRQELIESETGVLLKDGGVYEVLLDTVVTNSAAGGAGIELPENARVCIYIAAGATLTVRGGDGSGAIGGGAGILVPAGSTLILTGEGTLISEGGNAGNGGNGAAGEDGVTDQSGNYYYGGRGGAGGDGGGGAGAGIGTSGGAGAAGGNPSGYTYMYRRLDSTYAYTVPGTDTVASLCEAEAGSTCGTDGADGASGKKAGTPGSVFILGTLTVTAKSGEAGADGEAGAGGSGATTAGFGWTNCYAAGGGGGGGAGHGGYTAENGIGAGGSGGGAGGQGGSGGTFRSESVYTELTGAPGGCYDDAAEDGTSFAEPVIADGVWGGFGGAGGGTVKNTAGFTLEIEKDASVEGASLEAVYSDPAPDDTRLSLIHCSVVYRDGGSESFSGIKTDDFVTDFLYGGTVLLPAEASLAGYAFGGWYDDPDCLNGPVSEIDPSSGPGRHTVYAKWLPEGADEGGSSLTIPGKMKVMLFLNAIVITLAVFLFALFGIRHTDRVESRRVRR